MTKLFQYHVPGLTMAFLFIASALAQEASPAQEKQPANVDAAVTRGVRWLKTHAEAEPFDQSLSVLLARNLVSSNDLGIDVGEVHPALRSQLNLPEGAGLAVTAVNDESPGATAGIKPHDILLSVAGDKVSNADQLVEALKKADGKPVKIELLRQGRPATVEATPKSPRVAEIVLSDAPVTAWTQLGGEKQPRYRIGVVLSEADDTLRAQVGLAAGEGLIVTEVFPDTPAAKVGLHPHDVLVILDGKRLSTVDAINAQIQEIKDRQVELKLLRSGEETTLKIAPTKEEAAATTVLERVHGGLTIWRPSGCPALAKNFDCKSCHADPHAGWTTELKGYSFHRGLPQAAAPPGSPQEQVNQLKEQLAKMQETLSTLEASLAATAAKEQTQTKPEEKK